MSIKKDRVKAGGKVEVLERGKIRGERKIGKKKSSKISRI